MTYSLIYSFLTERAHFRAAEAVKKAAKGITTVKSGSQGEPNLAIIIKQWKKFAKGKKVASPYVLPAHGFATQAQIRFWKG